MQYCLKTLLSLSVVGQPSITAPHNNMNTNNLLQKWQRRPAMPLLNRLYYLNIRNSSSFASFKSNLISIIFPMPSLRTASPTPPSDCPMPQIRPCGSPCMVRVVSDWNVLYRSIVCTRWRQCACQSSTGSLGPNESTLKQHLHWFIHPSIFAVFTVVTNTQTKERQNMHTNSTHLALPVARYSKNLFFKLLTGKLFAYYVTSITITTISITQSNIRVGWI